MVGCQTDFGPASRPAAEPGGRAAGINTTYDMGKTAVCLPEHIKDGVAREARLRSCSRAEVIRQAVADAVSRPAPRAEIIPGDSAWAEQTDELQQGFGER